MQANRIQEDRYGGAENAQAMKQYLSKQPYDQKALTAANDALRNAAVNESLGAIFVGKGAKTWDKMKEADAMARLAKGEDAATVWKETGVGVAPWDKIARGEISDHIAPTKMDATVENLFKYPKVGEYMNHKPLYESYPDTQAITLANGQIGKGGGAWLKDQNVIELGAPYFNNKSLDTNRANKSTAIHELQHAIQTKEGFAKGGSPDTAPTINENLLNQIRSQKKNINIDPYAIQNKIAGGYHVPPEDMAKLDEWKKLVASEDDVLSNRLDPYEAYKRLSGEAEARLAQYRMNLTPEARSALYPYDPAYFKQATGVDIDKLITRGLLDDGPAMSVAPKLTEFEQRHLTAQKNAALPVEQGGLGLPEGNTAMDRARAMGFENAYHGTANDVQSFDIGKAGSQMTKDWGDAAYLTPSKSNAEYYAVEAGSKNAKVEPFKKYEDIERLYGNNSDETFKALNEYRSAAREAEKSPTGANVMPLMVDTSKAENYVVSNGMTDQFLFNNLRMGENGKDVARIMDNPKYVSEFAVYNPSRIRSRFAAFDPKRRHEADLLGYADPYLLGSMGVGGLLGMGGYSLMNDK